LPMPALPASATFFWITPTTTASDPSGLFRTVVFLDMSSSSSRSAVVLTLGLILRHCSRSLTRRLARAARAPLQREDWPPRSRCCGFAYWDLATSSIAAPQLPSVAQLLVPTAPRFRLSYMTNPFAVRVAETSSFFATMDVDSLPRSRPQGRCSSLQAGRNTGLSRAKKSYLGRVYLSWPVSLNRDERWITTRQQQPGRLCVRFSDLRYDNSGAMCAPHSGHVFLTPDLRALDERFGMSSARTNPDNSNARARPNPSGSPAGPFLPTALRRRVVLRLNTGLCGMHCGNTRPSRCHLW